MENETKTRHDFSQVTKVVIYPAIGIARVGNSPDEYFLGPRPGKDLDDSGDFRDSAKRIKRQGVKFYVYGLDADNNVLMELSEKNGAEVEWTVKIANKKAAWYNFDIALDIPAAEGDYDIDGNPTPGGLPVLSQRRNQHFEGDRSELMIRPDPQTIKGRKQKSAKYNGTIKDVQVNLGELRTDKNGRLIFLGGHGVSGAFENGDDGKPKPLTTFANNQGWYDDTSDGSVDAVVTFPGCGSPMQAEGAWVVTAPPNFAVGVQAYSTGYDLLLNTASQMDRSLCPEKPSFYKDIYPMLKHITLNQWVNAGAARDYGWGSAYDFEDETVRQRAADPSEAERPFRQSIFESFRNPDFKKMEANSLPPLYGDAVTFNVDSTDPRNWFAVTELQYANLAQWARGNFTADDDHCSEDWSDMTAEEQANGLTQAALEETLGGPFHPGCEFTWPMRHPMIYGGGLPFRVKPNPDAKDDFGVAISPDICLSPGGPLDGSAPGDITRWMAVPWQSDTSSCLSGYRALLGEYLPTFWPARVPNDVLSEKDYKALSDCDIPDEDRILAFSPAGRKKWLRGYIYKDDGQLASGPSITDRLVGVTKFTEKWNFIGIVVEKDSNTGSNPRLFPEKVWVETGRQDKELQDDKGEMEKGSDIPPAWFLMNPRKLR